MPPTNEALEVAWRALEGMGENQTSEGWRTIPVERTVGYRILAGRRFRSGDEAVLFGFPLPAVASDSSSLPNARGFHIEIVRERIPGETLAWFALVRQPAGNPKMFSRMASDIIVVLRGASVSGLPLFGLFTGRIRAWQAFMDSGRDDMLGPEAEIGLVGELTFLRQVLQAGLTPGVAIDGWRGPLDGMHDFVLGAGAVEVKATTASGEFPAVIGSLDQLDDSMVRPLFLAGVRLSLEPSGRTLPEIVVEVDTCLAKNPVARAQFSDLVLQAGVLDSVRHRYVRRFTAVHTVLFDVAGGFPRLTRRDVMQAVRKVRYHLDLDLVDTPPTKLDAALRELQLI